MDDNSGSIPLGVSVALSKGFVWDRFSLPGVTSGVTFFRSLPRTTCGTTYFKWLLGLVLFVDAVGDRSLRSNTNKSEDKSVSVSASREGNKGRGTRDE